MPDAPKGLTRGRPVLALAVALAAGGWAYAAVRPIEPHLTAEVRHMPGTGAAQAWFVDVRARGGGEVHDLTISPPHAKALVTAGQVPVLRSGETVRLRVLFEEYVDHVTTLVVHYRTDRPRTLDVEMPYR